MTEFELLARIDALQTSYLSALDRRDLDSWLGCFATEASYICTTRENEEQNLPLAIMMDDCRERLQDRVNFIRQVWAGTFEDYRTRHFVQRLLCRAKDEGIYEILSNFVVTYTTAEGRSEVLVTGCYEDEVELDAASARFRSKRAVLDTSTTPRYLVYPV